MQYKNIEFDPSKSWLNKQLTTSVVDSIKGILILLVVLGHSRWDNQTYQLARGAIYNFHAVLFLLLPFMFAVGPLTWERFKTLLRRYYTPLVWFVVAAFILKNIFLDRPPGISFDEIVSLGAALIMGTGHAFNSTVELELFWFLPTLFGLFFWRSIWPHLPKFGEFILGLAAAGVFLLAANLPNVHNLPTILILSLYACILGPLTFTLINLIYKFSGHFSPLVGGLGLLIQIYLLTSTGRRYNMAKINVPSLEDLFGIALYIGVIAFAFVTIEGLCRLMPIQKILAPIGRLSLGIYLIHMFMIVGFDIALNRLFPSTQSIHLISLFLALIISIAAAALINAIPPLKKTVFPR